MSPISKAKTRRIRDRKRAESIVRLLSEGTIDTYEGYRALYSLWCSNNAAVPELRPLFSISGIEPDGRLSVTDDFRTEIRLLSAKILPLLLD